MQYKLQIFLLFFLLLAACKSFSLRAHADGTHKFILFSLCNYTGYVVATNKRRRIIKYKHFLCVQHTAVKPLSLVQASYRHRTVLQMQKQRKNVKLAFLGVFSSSPCAHIISNNFPLTLHTPCLKFEEEKKLWHVVCNTIIKLL